MYSTSSSISPTQPQPSLSSGELRASQRSDDSSNSQAELVRRESEEHPEETRPHPEETRPLSWWQYALSHFNPSLKLQVKYGNQQSIGTRSTNSLTSGDAPRLGLNSKNLTTCPPCPSFPPIYPGGVGGSSQSTTTQSTTTQSTTTQSTTTQSTTTTQQPITSTNEDTSGSESQTGANTSGWTASTWAASGVQLELETRGNLRHKGNIQASLHSEAGININGLFGATVSANTGINLCPTSSSPNSIFTSTRMNGEIGGSLVKSLLNPFSPSEGVINTNTPSGAAAANVGIDLRREYHWDFGNTTRSKIKTSAIGTGLAAAHAAGAVVGGLLGAQVGQMNHGAAMGGALGSVSAAHLLTMSSLTGPDREVVSTEPQLTPLRGTLRMDTGGGNYVDLTASIEARARFERNIIIHSSNTPTPPSNDIEMVIRNPANNSGGDGTELRRRRVSQT